MMWKCTCVFVLVILVQAACASEMDVEVTSAVNGSFRVAEFQEKGSIFSLNIGAHNTGSESYDVRVRADVVRDKRILFTGWSSRNAIIPGERKSLSLYGYKPAMPGLSLMIRVYNGNEITELGPVLLNDTKPFPSQTAFAIENFRTYDDYIRFDLIASKTLDNVVIFPKDFPGTWIFGQQRMERMEKGAIKEVRIPYETGFFSKRDLSVAVATVDGIYYQEKEFPLEREQGVMKYIHLVMDFLGGVFRS